MDSTKDHNGNCELQDDEGTKNEASELEEENRPSRVTLRKKEISESEDNCHLLRPGKEPEVLESVQKYANRIKSFLGWEPHLDELEFGKEPGVLESVNPSANESSNSKSESEDTAVDKDKDHSSSQEEVEDKHAKKCLEAKPPPDLLDGLPNESYSGHISPYSESYDTETKTEITTEIEDNMNNDVCNEISDSVFPVSNNVQEKSKSSIPEMENMEKSDLENPVDMITDALPVLEDNTENPEIESERELMIANFDRNMPESKTFVGEIDLKDNTELTVSSLDMKQNGNEENSSNQNVDKIVENEHEIDLDKKYSLKNINKPYMDEIRRLSLDIVKDVIESARNSVHEMILNKSEPETIPEGECINDLNGDANIVNGFKNTENYANESENNIAFMAKHLDNFVKQQIETTYSKDNTLHDSDSEGREEYIMDKDTMCGYGQCTPQWIQNYATPKLFFMFYCILGILNGAYYTYFVSIISTLEKRYAFQAKVSNTLLLADEITPLLLGVIVGYFGGKTHRPRMVAIGMLSSAVCCFLSGLPYIFYGSSKHLIFHSLKNSTGPEVCVTQTTMESCNVTDRPPTLTVVGILLVASFLKGFATLSYYVIGLSYVDDIIKRKNTPVYFAVSLALRLLGPLVGFLMSSAFLKIYENPFDDPGFGADDPRWIGAWWMGFFLQGVLLVIFTLPIALFPRRLPSQKKVEKVPSVAHSESIKETLTGLLSALKRLGKNPIFIVLIINTTMKIFGHFGHAIMLPKYMENQFRLSAADASLFSGATSIFCVMISTVIGGFLIWKFRPTIKVLLAGMVASEIILSIGFLVLMIPRCQPTDMSHFGMKDDGLILNSICNQNCDCSTTSFTPFCGPDGKTTYFSPCYAGCTEELSPLTTTAKKQKEFGNCSCVNVDNTSDPIASKITEGFCPDDNCWSQTLAYLIILFVLLTISNTFTVAHTMILLRSVHPADKSVALGTFETFICLFGFIPFPVTFGALVDSACLVWEESCGETGNCWFYDMDRYAYLLHGAAALFCAFSTICLITLYCLSSRLRNLYVEDDEAEVIDNIKLDTVSGSVTKL